MAKELYSRTNQKMLFAGLSIANWRQAEASSAVDVMVSIQAEIEASLFHLYGAVLGLCGEIADYYQLPAEHTDVESFLCPAVLDRVPSPELALLLELMKQPDSWLSRLLSAYRQLFVAGVLPRAERRVPPPADGALITLVSVQEKQRLTVEQVEQWRGQLQEVISHCRESLVEY